MRRGLILLLLWVLFGTAIAANPPARRAWPWQAQANATAEKGAVGTLALEGRWTTSFLLGEPVVNCVARLRQATAFRVPVPGNPDADRIVARDGEVEIYSVMLVAAMDAPGAPTWNGQSSAKWLVFCDAGIVAQAGSPGFNVAGSPNWDRFFCAAIRTAGGFRRDSDERDQCAAAGGRWVPANEARAAARDGLDFTEFSIFDFSLNPSAAIRRVEKEDWRRRSAAFKQARARSVIDRIIDGSAMGAIRAVEAGRRLPSLPELPSTEQLQAYDQALYSLELEFARESERAAWREREKALVAAQLERLAVIDPAVRRADARLAGYRRQLESAAQSAPDVHDPLADALATPVSVFREGSLLGISDPDGRVLTPPRFADSCGRYEGLVCVADSAGRQAVVDPYGEALLDFQADQITLDGQLMACASSVVLKRKPPAGGGQPQFALYSLMEQRQTLDWVPGWHLRMRGASCEEGLQVLTSSTKVSSGCGYQVDELVFSYFSVDGRRTASEQRVRETTRSICLSVERLGG